MLYSEIIAVCSQIHTKHINTLCGQNVYFLMLNLVVYKVTTGLYEIKNVLFPYFDWESLLDERKVWLNFCFYKQDAVRLTGSDYGRELNPTGDWAMTRPLTESTSVDFLTIFHKKGQSLERFIL
jgi:hypothetical protein